MTSEATPLLAAGEQEHSTHRAEGQSNPEIHNDDRRSVKTRASNAVKAFLDHWSRWRVIYICGLFVFIIDIPEFMRVAPFLRMFELGVCRDYYKVVDPSVIAPNGDVEEALCKLGEIQSRFATLRGVLGAIGPLPGIFLAIPYGILADRVGRRFVILLCCFGVVFAESWILFVLWFWRVFPTTALFAFPVFLCIGGGGPVFAAVLLAVIADNCPSHYRTRVFFGVTVMYLITELVTPPVGSFLMERFDSYISYAATIPIRLASFLLPLFIPKTIPKEASDEQALDTPSEVDSTEPPKTNAFRQTLDAVLSHMRLDIYPLISRPSIVLSLLTFLVSNFARTQTEFTLQYVTYRFHWRYSQAAYLISVDAGMRIAMLCTVLPLVHAWLDRHYGHPEKANLMLAKGSIFFLILGPIILALADQVSGVFIAVVVFTFGSGFLSAIRSFVTSLVPKNETALLYTMISIVTNVGTLIGTPLIGLLFSAGIKKGGAAVGLPFFVGAALYFLSGLAVWFLSVPPKTADEERDQEDAEPVRAQE